MAISRSAEQSYVKNSDSQNLLSKDVILEKTVQEPSNKTLVGDTEAETLKHVAGVDFRPDKNRPPILRCRKRLRNEPEIVVKLSNSFSQDFPTRLWKIVVSDLFKSAKWDQKAIYMLLDEELFTREVLQRKSIRPTLSCLTLREFDQQLRLHGFKKLTSAAPNSKFSVYYYHSFRQHQEKLLRNIKVQVFESEEEEVEKEKLEDEDEDVTITGVIPAPPRHPGPPPQNTPSVPGRGVTWADQPEEAELLWAHKNPIARISSAVPPVTHSTANAPADTTTTPTPTLATSVPSSPVTFVARASSLCARPNTVEQNGSKSNNSTAHLSWVRLNHNQSSQASEPSLGRSLTTCPHSSVARLDVFSTSTHHQLSVSQAQFKEASGQAHPVPQVLASAQQIKQASQLQQAQLPQSHLIQQAQQNQAQHFQLAQAHQAHIHQAQQSQAQALYQQMVQAQTAWMQRATYNPWVLQAVQMQTAASMFPYTQYLHRPPGGFSIAHHIHPVFHNRGSSSVTEASRLRLDSGRNSPDLTSFPPRQSSSH